jgi:hypothetical protein
VPMSSLKRLVCVSAALVCGGGTALWADTRPNPFLSIVDRNPFSLKPIPPLPPPPDNTPPPLPLAKVVLTGVTSIIGPPRALLEITEQEPGKGPTVNKRILKEGERDGSVEVLSIDVVNNTVRIRNGTVETNVVFEVAKSGPAPGAPTPMPPVISTPSTSFAPPQTFNSAAAAPAPSAPLVIGGDNRGGRANTGVSFAGGVDQNASANAMGMGSRPVAGSSYAQNVNVNPFAGGGVSFGASGASPSTSRPLRTDTASAGPPITAAQADIQFEVQRHAYEQIRQAGGTGPPMPPTRFTKELYAQPPAPGAR